MKVAEAGSLSRLYRRPYDKRVMPWEIYTSDPEDAEDHLHGGDHFNGGPIIDPWEEMWGVTGWDDDDFYSFGLHMSFERFVFKIAIPLRCWVRRALKNIRLRRKRTREVLGRGY